MAKNVLPTNFQDDILGADMNGRRRYKLIQNADGTVSLEDASAYDQVGSNFGAGQINATNTAVNASADVGKIIDNTDDIMANTQKGMLAGALALKEVNSNLGGLKFGIDASGNYGYYKAGADSVTPFRGQPLIFTVSPADIKSELPDIYTNLTANDFLVCATGADISLGISKTMAPANYYDSIKCSKAYDPVTGKLTFSGFSRESNIPNGWWNTVATGVIAIYMR